MSEKFNKDRDELTNELLKIKQQNFEFGLKNQNLEKITDEMKLKIENMTYSGTANVNNLLNQVKELNEENENIKKEKSLLETQLNSKYKSLEKNYDNLSQQLTESVTDKDKLTLEYNKLASKNEDLKTKITSLNQNISELNKKLGEALAEISRTNGFEIELEKFKKKIIFPLKTI